MQKLAGVKSPSEMIRFLTCKLTSHHAHDVSGGVALDYCDGDYVMDQRCLFPVQIFLVLVT